MKELYKTAIFVAVALLLTGAAVIRIPGRSGTDEVFNDQGKPFFPSFKDPMACTDLEVVDYDPSTATAARFEVKFKGGKWVIPSHYDYPADAKDRLAKTAAGVMDLTKDTIRSDRVEDQEDLGVIDPLDIKSTSLKGRGKRVTLRDVSEKVQADFIIGKPVDQAKEKQGPDRTQQRYVRVPGQKRTYGVNLKVDLSTRFADWIETNLLKLDTGKIRKVIFDNYKIDLDQGVLLRGEKLIMERESSSGPWTLSAGIPEGQELNTEKISEMVNALGDLKIVGVRPKPAGLSRDLKTSNQDFARSESARRSLQSKGFFLAPNNELVSMQGDVFVETDEGVVYTLRFGEVNFATGEELSAGSAEDSEKAKAKDAKKSEGATESRYLMVTVAFDPTLIPEPKKEPAGPLTLPEDPFQLAPDDPKRVAEEKAEKEKAEKEKADREKKIADGQKRVQELSDRFANWYYVTPGESFRSIALDRKALVRAKQDKPADSMPAMPNFSGGAGFPHP